MTDSAFSKRERTAFSRLKAAVGAEQERLGLNVSNIGIRSAALLAETHCEGTCPHEPILVLRTEQAWAA